MRNLLMLLSALAPITLCGQDADPTYRVVDTGQAACYDDQGKTLKAPAAGEPFCGQDAQFPSAPMKYKDNGDGTVSDLNTGLTWQKTPDFAHPSTWADAIAGSKELALAGHDDWRVPSIKELYSLMNFEGHSGRDAEHSVPYIDARHFDFEYPDPKSGKRLIDAQYWSSTEYVGTTFDGTPTVFGVNFADGRIKGYPKEKRLDGKAVTHYVRHVRGNPKYGVNDFVDNGDGTITDKATGLTWMKTDAGEKMNWEAALRYADKLDFAGHSDWRLPDAKELQSIVDYTRAPDAADRAKRGPAIDPIFTTSEAESYFWTSTTHLEGGGPRIARGSQAVYIAFGRALGVFDGRTLKNVHGAGAQRSDPKSGDPKDPAWSRGRGPQNDDVRILNCARAVRSAK